MFLSNVCMECSCQKRLYGMFLSNVCMECSYQTSVRNVPIKCLYGMFLLNVCMECSYQASVWNVPVKRLYGMFLPHVFWHISYSMHYFHGCKNSGHIAWPSQQLVHFLQIYDYKYVNLRFGIKPNPKRVWHSGFDMGVRLDIWQFLLTKVSLHLTIIPDFKSLSDWSGYPF